MIPKSCTLGCDHSFSEPDDAVSHYETEHDGVVLIDTREKDESTLREVERVCEERDVGFVYRQLESGDYVYHGDEQSVAIEHKQIGDAVNSALNDRIYEQSDRMADRFDRAFVFIVGKMSEVRLRGRQVGYGQAYGQIIGVIPQILATMNVPVQWIRSPDKFADVGIRTLIDAGNKGLEDNETLLVSPGVARDPRLAMIQGLDGIGQSAAETILEETGSIEGLCDASYPELLEIDGVGSSTARQLWNTVHTEWDGPGMDPDHLDDRMWGFLDTSGVGDQILRDIWIETDGLRQDPLGYFDAAYDISGARGQRVREAIEEYRADEQTEWDDPIGDQAWDELDPRVQRSILQSMTRGIDDETRRRLVEIL